jgi:hypothetical protein
VIGRVLLGEGPVTPPWILRFLVRSRVLPRLLARVVGIGVRPEHVRTPVAQK